MIRMLRSIPMLGARRLAGLLLVLLATSGLVLADETRYFYDTLGRVIKVEYPDGKVVEYEYDPAGNILRRLVTVSPSPGTTAPAWRTVIVSPTR